MAQSAPLLVIGTVADRWLPPETASGLKCMYIALELVAYLAWLGRNRDVSAAPISRLGRLCNPVRMPLRIASLTRSSKASYSAVVKVPWARRWAAAYLGVLVDICHGLIEPSNLDEHGAPEAHISTRQVHEGVGANSKIR